MRAVAWSGPSTAWPSRPCPLEGISPRRAAPPSRRASSRSGRACPRATRRTAICWSRRVSTSTPGAATGPAGAVGKIRRSRSGAPPARAAAMRARVHAARRLPAPPTRCTAGPRRPRIAHAAGAARRLASPPCDQPRRQRCRVSRSRWNPGSSVRDTIRFESSPSAPVGADLPGTPSTRRQPGGSRHLQARAPRNVDRRADVVSAPSHRGRRLAGEPTTLTWPAAAARLEDQHLRVLHRPVIAAANARRRRCEDSRLDVPRTAGATGRPGAGHRRARTGLADAGGLGWCSPP